MMRFTLECRKSNYTLGNNRLTCSSSSSTSSLLCVASSSGFATTGVARRALDPHSMLTHRFHSRRHLQRSPWLAHRQLHSQCHRSHATYALVDASISTHNALATRSHSMIRTHGSQVRQQRLLHSQPMTTNSLISFISNPLHFCASPWHAFVRAFASPSGTGSSKKRDQPFGYDSLLSIGSWETAKGLHLRHRECAEILNDVNCTDNVLLARTSKEMRALEESASLVSNIERLRTELQHVRSLLAETQMQLQRLSNNQTSVGTSPSSPTSVSESIADAQSMLDLATEEHKQILHNLLEHETKLIDHLLPDAADQTRNVILEVRAGTGGEEAALFARDMYEMYEKYALLKGWSFEVLATSVGEHGGFKEATASIVGEGVFGRLQYETGVHRVQRIPATETQGRVHTSVMTVAVLPEAEEIDIEINESRDLRIDVFRSGGKGGQHVNTTDSAVRITHLPTGMVVAIQDERSLIQNKAKAMRLLRSRLYEIARQREQKKRDSLRASQIGAGERHERIRTYNFNQNRITDHRINLTKHAIDKFMDGELLDDFSEALRHQARLRAIQEMSE